MIDNTSFYNLFNITYFFTAFLVILSTMSIEIKKDYTTQIKIGKILVVLPLTILIIIIGLRDFNVGTDTYNYYNLLWLNDEKISFSGEFLFNLIAYFIKKLGLGYNSFLMFIAFFYILIFYLAFKNICKFYGSNILYIFFAFLSMFFFMSLSINIIRQGISLAFLSLAYSYFFNKDNKYKIILSIIISISFHITSIIPIIIFTVVYMDFKIIRERYYYYLFFIFIVLSYLNIGLLDISPYLIDLLGSDNRRVGYLSSEDIEYTIGFKPQFVFFNTFFLFVALYVRKIIIDSFIRNNYDTLVKYYILASCLFFMAFQIPYSDRWGLFSWISIPILIAPLFSIYYVKRGIRIHWIILFILIFVSFNIYDKQ